MIALDLSDPVAARALALHPVSDGLRAAAIATWRGRMINETQSSYVFASLSEQLGRAGMREAQQEAESFAEEERRHGRRCASVVVALGGSAICPVDPTRAVPAHAAVGLEEAIARNVLSIGCLSETVAVALIGAEREEMSEGPLRALLTSIWADEIGHARFGWRHLERALPGLDASARARLSAYLRVALRHLEAHELEHLPVAAGPRSPELGVCEGASARTLFYATVLSVIVPRLDALGLAATDAWRSRHATSRHAQAAPTSLGPAER